MSVQHVRVNRAPVLTLWASVVAGRLGFSRDEALTMGRVVAGLNAYAKGKSLGLYQPQPQTLADRRKQLAPNAVLHVDLLNRAVPLVHTSDGLRALSKDKPIDPRAVQRYLESKFGAALPDVERAMESLAGSMGRDELRSTATHCTSHFGRRSPPESKVGVPGAISISGRFGAPQVRQADSPAHRGCISRLTIGRDPVRKGLEEFAQKSTHRFVGQGPRLVEQFVRAANIGLGLLHCGDIEEYQRLSQVMIRAKSADRAGRCAHDRRRLSVPGILAVGTRSDIECVLQNSGDRAVVLGRHEQHGIARANGFAKPEPRRRWIHIEVLIVECKTTDLDDLQRHPWGASVDSA